MSYTNETKKLHLPQWVGTDRPTYLVDFNTAFLNIDNAFIAQDVEIASILSKVNTFISKMLGTVDDLNNLDNGHYSLPPNDDYTKQNRPTKKAGFLYVYNDNVGTWQIYVDSDSQMYIRSKLHDGNWSSWNRLVGESEYKNFVNNVNNDIGQIRNTANNAESVANNAESVANSANNIANSKFDLSNFVFQQGNFTHVRNIDIQPHKTESFVVDFIATSWENDLMLGVTNFSGIPTGLAVEGWGWHRTDMTGTHKLYLYVVNTTDSVVTIRPDSPIYIGAMFAHKNQ